MTFFTQISGPKKKKPFRPKRNRWGWGSAGMSPNIVVGPLILLSSTSCVDPAYPFGFLKISIFGRKFRGRVRSIRDGYPPTSGETSF